MLRSNGFSLSLLWASFALLFFWRYLAATVSCVLCHTPFFILIFSRINPEISYGKHPLLLTPQMVLLFYSCYSLQELWFDVYFLSISTFYILKHATLCFILGNIFFSSVFHITNEFWSYIQSAILNFNDYICYF